MTDLENFKKLFTTCRIWRGGGSSVAMPDGSHQFIFDINVECNNGKTEYIELVAHFSPSGEWERTTKVSRAKGRK